MMNLNNIPWCEKYRAKCFGDVRGQELAVDKVKLFLRSFPKKKAIVLYGSPGVGKTSLAYAIAFENDAEILELNASDFRNKAKISEIIGPASQQKSLFRKNKIILVDEVDGIAAIKDRGGLGELLGLLEKSAFPIIITANDVWNKKFSLLRRKAEVIQLKDVDYKIVLEIYQSEQFTILFSNSLKKRRIVLIDGCLTGKKLKNLLFKTGKDYSISLFSKIKNPGHISIMDNRYSNCCLIISNFFN